MRPLIASLLLIALPLPGQPQLLAQDHVASGTETFKHTPPTELYEVVRVVDGDTVHIQYKGRKEKLRLLSVDTEEKFDVGPTKPATVFGEECAQWAEKFFADLTEDDTPSKIGVAFPGGVERRDIYGRLLCHVVLPDGTDFNLLLVQLGKSPYFNKYGNSLICHEAFVEAQKKARSEKLGIWNPKTNQPKSPDRPAAKRPYEELLVWWDARAQAIDNFRAAHAEDPEKTIESESPESLSAAAKHGREVRVFCIVSRQFDEKDGSKTYLMRSGDKQNELRVKIAKDDIETIAKAFDFEALTQEFEQNYCFVTGVVKKGPRGFEIWTSEPDAWTLAGPSPAKK